MPIKVLVVDDSLFMRTLISDMLNSDPAIEVVDTAQNGKEAVNKIPKTKPNCVTLDLVMPGWDGFTTLKHIMAEHPTPCVILSAHSKEDADITIQCLNAGAVGFVLKPSGELSLDIENIKHQLLEEVKVASKVELEKIKSLTVIKPKRRRRKLVGINKIIVIGASTGGPQTLESILSSLPPDFPAPIIVVQHMPNIFFTQSLAEHLSRNCQLQVKVAENNEIIQAGKVYLAPGGFQMTLSLLAHTEAVPCISEAEPDSLAPSIDLAMESVAKVFNGNAVGIILSGMGCDGRQGAKAIKESGGNTIAQDESSLIFGMPKAVIDAGYADKVLPADEIAEAIMESVCQETINA